jgi:hypothetical protein
VCSESVESDDDDVPCDTGPSSMQKRAAGFKLRLVRNSTSLEPVRSVFRACLLKLTWLRFRAEVRTWLRMIDRAIFMRYIACNQT